MNTDKLYEIFLAHPIVCTDTRKLTEGGLFFALRGANFNGNLFALEALEAGCAYAVVDNKAIAAASDRLLLVDDVLTTLQELAALHRRRMGTPILQITGTNGKTTTKELCAAVLSTRFNTLFTQGNLNNHIGVPLTLLRLTREHEVAVIETGANHPGEIAALSRIVDADCGLITNVGLAHLAGFGSLEGVVRTKGELFDYLRTRPDRRIFLCGDNERLAAISGGLPRTTYGRLGRGYDVEGLARAGEPFLCLDWKPQGGRKLTARTRLVGAYNADNALAAAAVGLHFGLSPEQINTALEAYEPGNNRSEYRQTGHNALIIDAYNANPTSMKAALDNFATVSHPHKMAILGAMGELGEASRAEHEKLIPLIEAAGCEEVWLVGKEFDGIAPQYRHFADIEAVKEFIDDLAPAYRLILIKGSNAIRLFELPPLL